MKPAEIRALSDTELLNELENVEQKLFNLHFQRTTQNLESTAELRKTRRDIARLRTILAERQRARGAPLAAATAQDSAKSEASDK